MNITLTGIDCLTSDVTISRLLDLGAELGILYSWSTEERHRYQHPKVVEDIVRDYPGSIALHVCGRAALEALKRGLLNATIPLVSRLQVNGCIPASEILRICAQYPETTIITQWSPANRAGEIVAAQNHELLIDASGGRGVMHDISFLPTTSKRLGLAGGLTPQNVLARLIDLETRFGFVPAWVDVESGVRDASDWFSEDRALKFISAARAFTESTGN